VGDSLHGRTHSPLAGAGPQRPRPRGAALPDCRGPESGALCRLRLDPSGCGHRNFYVILAPAPGTTLPAENRVEVCVQPTSKQLPEACYPGTLQDLRDRVQYYSEVEFDRQEMWRVRVRVRGVHGSGELVAEVEATPPGFGVWDLLIYGFPFLLFGALWLCAALRGRRRVEGRGAGAAERVAASPDRDGQLGTDVSKPLVPQVKYEALLPKSLPPVAWLAPGPGRGRGCRLLFLAAAALPSGAGLAAVSAVSAGLSDRGGGR
jgi:hypothetical protein